MGILALMDVISYRPRGATDTTEHRAGASSRLTSMAPTKLFM